MYRLDRQKWVESKIEIRVNEICETLMIVASGMVIETSTWLPSLGVGSVENRERRGNNIQMESAHQMRAKWAWKKIIAEQNYVHKLYSVGYYYSMNALESSVFYVNIKTHFLTIYFCECLRVWV